MANETIKYKQLYDEGEPFYPVVGKSSYNQWVGYEEVNGTPPDENFVTPIENGGTGANNASDALSNLGLSDAFTTGWFDIQGGSVSANGTAWFEGTPTKTGYKCLGAVGFYIYGNGHYMNVYAHYYEPATGKVFFAVRNMGSSALTITSLRSVLLWVKV